MATVLNESPLARRGMYGFTDYADGNWWLLKREEDFPVDHTVDQVRESAKAWVRRRGYKLNTRKVSVDELAIKITVV